MASLKVLVTGAAGQIAYSLMHAIAKGDVFGPDQTLTLVMLDIPPMAGVLKGVEMELEDCALPLLKDVISTTDYKEAFSDIDVAILVGAMPRREGMERKDLLKANAGIFQGQGKALDQYAKKSVKIARRIGKTSNSVCNVIIWGNHSSTQYPDVRHALVCEAGGKRTPVPSVVQDDAWLNGDFITTVQKRGAAVIAARKLSSAMSAAKAIGDHVRDWWFGTKKAGCCGDGSDLWTSMGVYSDGSHYGIPADIIYSFPLKIENKDWTIVDGLTIDDASRARMDATAKELVEERDAALQFLGN